MRKGLRPEQDSNLDLCDAGEALKQLSYEANQELLVIWVDNVLVDDGYISIYLRWYIRFNYWNFGLT